MIYKWKFAVENSFFLELKLVWWIFKRLLEKNITKSKNLSQNIILFSYTILYKNSVSFQKFRDRKRSHTVGVSKRDTNWFDNDNPVWTVTVSNQHVSTSEYKYHEICETIFTAGWTKLVWALSGVWKGAWTI